MSYDTIVEVTSDASAKVSVGIENKRPEFDDGTSTDRYVREGTDAAVNIVGLVGATDPNEDSLAYTLGGTDKDSFSINVTDGQLMTKAKLDYEGKKSYTVTVTADDSRGEANSTATITVTIMVTDVDEAPMIMVGGLAISGMSSIRYAENRRDAVATYVAAGADADRASWSLEGADTGDFRISSAGVLTFRSSPNYEMPADANTDNTYMVTVKADDGTSMDTHDVTVTVTNVEEMGEVTLWAGSNALTMAPQVGDRITGAVMDPDGGETVQSWQWSRSRNMTNWEDINGETDAAYMTMAMDEGYYLRVMATYTDAVGTDTAMEYSMSTMMVTAVGEMMGEVTLWAGAVPLTMAPQVGDRITGAVMDPDGGVTGESWQWSRTSNMNSWMNIQDATNAAYMVTADDTGHYLRVMATYTDAVGADTAMVYSMPTMMVDEAMPPGGTELERLIARYDTSGDGNIDKGELFDAIDGYLGFGSGPSWDSEGYTKKGLFDLIDSYLGF